MAQSDKNLVTRTDSKVISVMVKLDVDALASYSGNIPGYAATSPSVTGKTLRDSGAATGSYTTYLLSQVAAAQRSAKSVVPGIAFGTNYLVAYGGFEARVPANQAKNLLKVPGVVAVQMDNIEQPEAAPQNSANFIGADAAWPKINSAHPQLAGAGTILADIDTGVWPENPMLNPSGIPSQPHGSYSCDFGISGQSGDAAYSCNNKVLGAKAFLQTNLIVTGPGLPGEFCPNVSHCSARDADGHGTHTTTTAVGDVVNSAIVLGVERGPVSGVAPGASVIEYRVCDTDGCFGSDSVAAVQQAITDGVDAINFSISGGADPYSDPVELAFLDAYAAGISVSASAGNSGPGAATSDHAGPWTTTVGATTWNQEYGSTLHLTAAGGATLDVSGVTITAGVTSPTPVVLASAAPYSDSKCQNPASSGTFTGEVVVCERGTNARIDKGYNVLQGGAAGMVLYNVSVTDLETDNHFLPAIHVNDASSSIAAFVSGHTNVMATWVSGTIQPTLGDEMASFSSRGPLGDFIKPDIAAPGVQVMAGNSYQHLFDPAAGLGPNGQNYQAIAGTSMASPHSAGSALLIKAAHPSWKPGQIKSAVMTTAAHDVVKEDGTTPATPFDTGAGGLKVDKALSPTVTFNVTPTQYYSASSDPLNFVNLNLPSIDAADMQGVVETTRTAMNVTNVSQTFAITAKGPGGSIRVSPSLLTIPAGQSRPFTVKIDATALADGQYFGSVTLKPKSGAQIAVLPVAFNKQPSSNVSFSNTCDSNTVAVGGSVNCDVSATNLTPDPAHVTVRVRTTNGNVKLQYSPPATKLKPRGFIESATLSSSLPPPVTGLDNPADDPFVDLSSCAGCKLTGAFANGDESILNLSLSHAVRFGDQVYSTIGAVTDGYLVVGGGASADVAFSPQTMPNPAKPNGVIAPYWTDLNFGGGGDFYVAIFDCGPTLPNCAYEFEWKDIPIYGTTHTRSFAVWMYTDSYLSAVAPSYTGDNNEIVYDTGSAVAGDAGTPLNIGAEDVLGLTGVQLAGMPDNTGTVAPDADGYYVVTGPSAPGGTLDIPYTVWGMHAGNTTLRGSMVSDHTVGTAKAPVTIHVSPAV